MSAVRNDVRQSDREAMLVDCAARMTELFWRLPMLIGFTLDAKLGLADVAVQAWPGFQAAPKLHAEIAAAILEVLEEHPDALELLPGCTFARAFH